MGIGFQIKSNSLNCSKVTFSGKHFGLKVTVKSRTPLKFMCAEEKCGMTLTNNRGTSIRPLEQIRSAPQLKNS